MSIEKLFSKIQVNKNSSVMRFNNNSLYKNSIFLILANTLNSGFGFIFWLVAAKLYSPSDVGIASASISSIYLLILISRLGYDVSMMRFFSEKDKSKIFSTVFTITTLIAVLFAIIFISKINIIIPKYQYLNSPIYAAAFIVILIILSLDAVLNLLFISLRKSEFNALRALLQGIRIFSVIPLVILGTLGILCGIGISMAIVAFLSILYLTKYGIRLKLEFDRSFLIDTFRYSFSNYLVGIFLAAPIFILPSIVLKLVGEESTAYFYIAFSIASLLFMIPSVTAQVLFVEGSCGESIRKNTIKSLLVTFCLLIPGMIILQFYGEYLLGLVGKPYMNSFDLLRIMAFSSFFVAIYQTYVSIMRIKKEMGHILIMSGLMFVSIIILSYYLVERIGVVGVGYAWAGSYALSCFFIMIYYLIHHLNR